MVIVLVGMGVNICVGARTYEPLYKIASAEFHQTIEGLIIAALILVDYGDWF
jgi:hypothetical protein